MLLDPKFSARNAYAVSNARSFLEIPLSFQYGIAALTTSFDDSIRYSKATKEFVSALILAIDRGNTNAAHAELRKFDSVSVETYEGGSFLGWLRDAVKRLSEDATIDSDSDTVTDEHTAETAAQVGE